MGQKHIRINRFSAIASQSVTECNMDLSLNLVLMKSKGNGKKFLDLQIFSCISRDSLDNTTQNVIQVNVHYRREKILKYRTDLVFGTMDLIVAFGGTSNFNKNCIKFQSFFRNRWSFSRLLLVKFR